MFANSALPSKRPWWLRKPELLADGQRFAWPANGAVLIGFGYDQCALTFTPELGTGVLKPCAKSSSYELFCEIIVVSKWLPKHLAVNVHYSSAQLLSEVTVGACLQSLS